MIVLSLVALALVPPLKVTERTIAGTSSDFMIVRYIRLEGTNEQIGMELAQIAQKRHHVEPAKEEPSLVWRRLAWRRQNWPEDYERAMGVRKVFGASPDVDPTQLNYDADVNPACSVVYYPGSSISNGHAMLSRNYDFSLLSYAEITRQPKPKGARAMTADPYVMAVYPDKGFASLYLGAYDLLSGAIDGINEKGVAVALLADDMAESHQSSNAIGLSEIRFPRFVLERCASAKEARKLLKDAPYNYSFVPCHYMICDCTGDSFVWEITPDLKRRSMVGGNGKPQIVTNHRLEKYGTANLPAGNSFDRFRRLQQEIANRNGRITPEEAGTINKCVAVPLAFGQAATLWHSVYDLKERSMKVSFFLGKSAQGERRTPYYAFALR